MIELGFGFTGSARGSCARPLSKEMILNFVGEHVLRLPRSY